jgi:hypothetical protein
MTYGDREYMHVRHLQQVRLPVGSNSTHEAFFRIEVLLYHECMLYSVDKRCRKYCCGRSYTVDRFSTCFLWEQYWWFVGVHRIWNFEIRPEPDLPDLDKNSGRNRHFPNLLECTQNNSMKSRRAM